MLRHVVDVVLVVLTKVLFCLFANSSIDKVPPSAVQQHHPISPVVETDEQLPNNHRLNVSAAARVTKSYMLLFFFQ